MFENRVGVIEESAFRVDVGWQGTVCGHPWDRVNSFRDCHKLLARSVKRTGVASLRGKKRLTRCQPVV